MPSTPSWPDGKRFAVFVNVAFEAWGPGRTPGVSPMGNPLPSGLFDSPARSWGDYGFTCGVWRLLEVLRAQRLRATFLTSGILTELAPDAVIAIAEAGHPICAHGWSQDEFGVGLDPERERATIIATRDALAEAAGAPPQGWTYPRATCGPDSARLLADEGFRWFADRLDHDHAYLDPADPRRRILALPFTMEVNDLPARMKHGFPADVLERAFDHMLAAARRFGDGRLHFDVTVHAHLSGRPLGAYYFERILDKIRTLDDAWVTTRDEAADHVRADRPAS
jgi:peptidoglycan/xylan/chitin deacetylase (PgdA/CDA1 family)